MKTVLDLSLNSIIYFINNTAKSTGETKIRDMHIMCNDHVEIEFFLLCSKSELPPTTEVCRINEIDFYFNEEPFKKAAIEIRRQIVSMKKIELQIAEQKLNELQK